MLKKWFHGFLNRGIYPNTAETQVKNIRIMNAMYLLVIITEASVIPMGIVFFKYAWPVLIVCSVMIILVTLTLRLVSAGKYHAAAVLGALAAVNNITWFTILLGTGMYVHFLMPAIMVGAFYYFSYENRKSLFLVIGISMTLFLFLEVWFLFNKPLIAFPEHLHWLVKIFVDIMFSVITFGFMYYGYRIYRESEESLRESRRILADRNQILETELEMARRIQMQIIPSRSPDPRIAFFYQPMDKVGGDFFDFIHFGDNANTGIFLSDVSGHGVPAAFITSMIKSALMEYAHETDDPGKVLSHLNQSLYGQTGGNFVTAFYAIYNWKTREMVYSNAGHNLPYILNRGNVKFLDSQHSAPPLFVLQNHELVTLHKDYQKEICRLEEHSRILFYTDGLTEAVREKTDGKQELQAMDFESSELIQSMYNLEKMAANDFVTGLYTKLRDYRGSNQFEDDVCIITLDAG